jgi:hypothetical protein
MKKLEEIIAFREAHKGACVSTTHDDLVLGEVVEITKHFKDKQVSVTRPTLYVDDKEQERVWTVTIKM